MGRRGAIAVAVVAGLVVATFAVYGQVRHHAFVELDDPQYVVANPHLAHGLTLEAVARVFAEPYFFNWAPLTLVSYQLERDLHGGGPAGTLLTNVALHAASSVLLFLFLWRTTGATGRSAFVAAVFALHPLHVESVAWASSRKDVLSGLFFMLVLLGWARFAERPTAGRYALVFAALALGLLAKATLVTLPFLLLLLDAWPLRRLGRVGLARAVGEKAPLFALVAAATVVTWLVQRETLAMPETPPAIDQRLGTAVHSAVVYLAQSFWPTDLACFYPYPPRALGPGAWRLAADAVLLVGVTLFCASQRARPWLAVGWLWYLGVLLPVSGIVQTGMQVRADRYLYLPQIGLAIVVAWGAVDALGHRRGARVATATLAGLALLALGVTAWRQVATWRDSATLYAHALRVTERNYFAHRGLGAELARAGRLEEAAAAYRASVGIHPRWPTSRHEASLVLLRLGRPDAALVQAEAAVALAPDEPAYRAARGTALADLGRLEEARAELRSVVDALPRAADARGVLARVELLLGHEAAALREARTALAVRPGEANATRAAAWLLLRATDPALRDPEEAAEILGVALASSPVSADLLALLAQTRAASGRYGEAAEVAERGIAQAEAEGRTALAASLRSDLEAYQDERLRDERLPKAQAPSSR